MRFEARTFWLPKDADETAQYQDAFALDAETGRAAIADGVSSAIFSGPWARLLSLAVVAEPPPLEDSAAFQAWLSEKRLAWSNGIDTAKLTWYQRPKMADGAMTTLLWLNLLPAQTNAEGRATNYRLETFAIGDSCLFHVRAGRTLYWFPLESSDQFGLNPAVVASVDRQLDHLLEFKAREHDCLPGDLLVLATDAVALWAVHRQESGDEVDWSRYWDYSDDAWSQEIFSFRDAKQMRFDDSTLVLLRVIEERPAPVVESPELPGDDLAATIEPLPAEVESDVPVGQADGREPSEAAAVESTNDAPLASLAEAIESEDALRFDAAVEESIEQLKDVTEVEEALEPLPPVAIDNNQGESDDDLDDAARAPT